MSLSLTSLDSLSFVSQPAFLPAILSEVQLLALELSRESQPVTWLVV